MQTFKVMALLALLSITVIDVALGAGILPLNRQTETSTPAPDLYTLKQTIHTA